MTRCLVIKTGALGDVLRTTSILPGLAEAHPGLALTWVTAPEALDLVVQHPNVERVLTVDPKDGEALRALGEQLAGETWDRILSLDDERSLCALASRVGAGRGDEVQAERAAARLSGACLDAAGEPTYTDDFEPWFGMGLLAKDGREAADARKIANQRSHAEIFAAMLGIRPGRPELPVPAAALAAAERRLGATPRPRIGLNTGAGGRWRTKALPVARVVELVERLDDELEGQCSFVLFGGGNEAGRNAELMRGFAASRVRNEVFDTGTDNALLDFAALVDRCDVLVTSDSLGMHVAIARDVPVVAFFAPTSATEIGLYGRGEKVVSRSPDYCSYRPDADNSTITAERVAAATLRVLAGDHASRE